MVYLANQTEIKNDNQKCKTSIGWELIPTTSEEYEKIVLEIEQIRVKYVMPFRVTSRAKNSRLGSLFHSTDLTEQ